MDALEGSVFWIEIGVCVCTLALVMIGIQLIMMQRQLMLFRNLMVRWYKEIHKP